MKKYSDYYPIAFGIIISLAVFLLVSGSYKIFIGVDLFFILLLLLIFVSPLGFAFKYNDKIYFHSKSIADSGSKWWSLYYLYSMGFLYITLVIILLFSILYPFNLIPFIIPFFIATLPGLYLASKNFLFFKNKKLNSFPIRLFFLIPGASILCIAFLAFVSLSLYIFSSYLDELNLTSIIILVILSMIGSLLAIFYFKKYLKDELPPEYQTDFMDHELYVFMPVGKKINDRASYQPSDNAIGSVRIQIMDLKISAKKLKGDIFFTKYGALIVSNKTLEIFNENTLTGYQIRDILDEKTKDKLSTHFQLVPTFTMPPMSAQTKLKRGLVSGLLIPDDKIYYNSIVLKHVSDFNKTFEYIGTNSGRPYYHQKFWIVSHKAMEILINQPGQHKRDFIPVMLVSNEKED